MMGEDRHTWICGWKVLKHRVLGPQCEIVKTLYIGPYLSVMKVILRQPNLENPAAGVIVETADVPSADLLPGTVRVAISLRPINPADIFSLMGTLIDV